MLNIFRLPVTTGALLFSLCAIFFASPAFADPSGRVAYLSDTQGQVSYSPSGEDQWIGVVRNRPLIRGDRLWTDRGALAEFQFGSSAIRLASNTGVEILDLDDRFAQLQLTEGTLSLTVRRMYEDQVIEVDTPLLAFTITRAGRYRIDVDPQYEETTIVVWEGAGEAYGDDSNFRMRAGDTVRFYDTDLRDHEIFRLPHEDDLDRYSLERDLRFERSDSLRYIDDDLVGYTDLDEYGSWRRVRGQGHVWFPNRVEAGWAPYRYGHWVWQEPWGWTWIDNAPWGFAPSHYGRWVSVHNRWGWVPGPRHVRPVYAPALVAFVGGSGWSLSLSMGGGSSAIGWFPLGPREVYVPSYYGSRDYFNRVNQNNTVINNTTITNVYNNYSSGTINVNQVNYTNRTSANAVTAVPRDVFVRSQPVRESRLNIDARAGTTGEVFRVAPVAPTVHSVIGAGKATKVRPAHEVFERKVVAHRAPPPATGSFAKREQLLQKNPGRPLEPSVADSLNASNAKMAKNVRMIDKQKSQVDARAAGSARVDKSAKPQQLDRSDQNKKGAKRTMADAQPANGQQQRKADSDKQTAEQQQRKADSDKQAAEQQQRKADSDKQAEQQQRKADSDKQAEQQQRKADSDKQAAEQHQRKADSDRQAAEQQQRKADSERQAAQQQQRKAESDKQAEQQQRKADSDKRAAEQNQRKAESDKQAEQQQQRKADSDMKAAEQQQRKAESDKQAAQQQQRKADSDRQAAEQQQRKAESDKQAAQQQQRKADSDRQAAEQQQRKAASDKQAAEQQQRKADSDRQAQELQRKADSDRQAAQLQQRQADGDRKAAQQQQRKADSDKQAAEQQQRKADGDRQAAQQQQIKADSDKQAAEQQQRKADSDKQAAQQQQNRANNDRQVVDEPAAQQGASAKEQSPSRMRA